MFDDVAVPERWRLGENSVPKGRYIDLEFLELELERLFPRTWLMACRLEEVAQVGAFVELEVGDESIVVVRPDTGQVRAFFNSCRHRGTRLVRGSGRLGEFRCPFHAWRWDLGGALTDRPDDASFAPRPAGELCLAECRCDTWGGFVFVNMDLDAEDLDEYLAPLPARLEGFKLQEMRYRWHKRVVVPANWKTAVDAFIEAYHVPGTHPQFLRPRLTPATPATRAEVPLWPPSVTESHGRHARTRKPTPDPEQVEPIARATARSGLTPLEQTQVFVEYQLRELGSLNTDWDRRALERVLAGELPEDPFEQHLRYLATRREMAAADGVRLPDLTPEQVRAGAYDWLVFPNTVLLVTGTVGSVLGYRALPDGHDPDSCVFDMWSMQLFAPGAAPDVTTEVFEDWHDAALGEVLTQDLGNLAAVTAGMHSRSFDAAHLNLRQEMSIHHYHQTADGYLFGSGGDAG